MSPVGRPVLLVDSDAFDVHTRLLFKQTTEEGDCLNADDSEYEALEVAARWQEKTKSHHLIEKPACLKRVSRSNNPLASS